MRAIATGSWPMLNKSNLQPLLAVFSPSTCEESQGGDLDDLQRWISQSPILNDEYIDACLKTTQLLQIGLDEWKVPRLGNRKSQMLFVWPILTPTKFLDLIRRRQQEALVILAHYALLLHNAGRLEMLEGTSSTSSTRH